MSKALLIILAMFSTTGCSNKAIYDSLRENQRNECLKEPPPTYFECVEGTNKSYEEYERERKELLEKASRPVEDAKQCNARDERVIGVLCIRFTQA